MLLTTGRLTGGAAATGRVLPRHRAAGGRRTSRYGTASTDWLAHQLARSRAGGTGDGPVLALAGAIDAGQVTLADLERRGRAWLPPVPGTLAAATDPPGEPAARQRRAAIEAAVLGNRLRRNGRLDLAADAALLLLRAAWCHALSADRPRPAPQPVGGGRHPYVRRLRRPSSSTGRTRSEGRCAPCWPRSRRTFAHVSYPVACARLAEILGLLGLLADGAAPDVTAPLGLRPDRIARTVQDLLEHQPGCAHPVATGSPCR